MRVGGSEFAKKILSKNIDSPWARKHMRTAFEKNMCPVSFLLWKGSTPELLTCRSFCGRYEIVAEVWARTNVQVKFYRIFLYNGFCWSILKHARSICNQRQHYDKIICETHRWLCVVLFLTECVSEIREFNNGDCRTPAMWLLKKLRYVCYARYYNVARGWINV